MATISSADPTKPFLLRIRYTTQNESAKQQAITSLQSCAQIQTSNHPNVLTYHFAQDTQHPLDLILTEIYRNQDVFWKHAESEAFHQASSKLFDPQVKKNSVGVAVGDVTEGVKITTKAINATVVPLIAGFLDASDFKGKPKVFRPKNADSPILISFTIPNLDSEKQKKVIERLKNFMTYATNVPSITTCVLYPSSDKGLELLVVSIDVKILVGILKTSKRQVWDQLKELVPEIKFVFYGNVMQDVKQMLDEESLEVRFEEVVAGYTVHPKVIERMLNPQGNPSTTLSQPKTLSSSTLSKPPPPPPNPISHQRPEPSKPNSESPHKAFEIVRNTFTDAIESLRFLKYTHIIPIESTLIVPILSIISHLSLRGVGNIEVPMDMLYCQLERFRSIQRNAALLNRIADIPLSQREQEDIDSVETFLENMHNMGFTMRSNDKYIHIEAMDEVITMIEDHYRRIIEDARQSLENDACVPYKGLLELYKIGSFVVGPGPAGMRVAFRVIDAYYDTQRSLFGGRKFFFKLGLSFLINVGKEFAVCNFEEDFEEFMGYRPVVTVTDGNFIGERKGEFGGEGNVVGEDGESSGVPSV